MPAIQKTFKEDVAHKTTGIGAEAVLFEPTVILNVNVEDTECVPIWAKTLGPSRQTTKGRGVV